MSPILKALGTLLATVITCEQKAFILFAPNSHLFDGRASALLLSS